VFATNFYQRLAKLNNIDSALLFLAEFNPIHFNVTQQILPLLTVES
jgi:hypothetical protein